jgi:hypothetical protein
MVAFKYHNATNDNGLDSNSPTFSTSGARRDGGQTSEPDGQKRFVMWIQHFA